VEKKAKEGRVGWAMRAGIIESCKLRAERGSVVKKKEKKRRGKMKLLAM
jgi:hypothetical protein